MSINDSVTLEALRGEIDGIDLSLLKCLCERYSKVREVGRLKVLEGLPALDPGREAEIVRRVAAEARLRGLPEEAVRDVYWRVLSLCRVSEP